MDTATETSSPALPTPLSTGADESATLAQLATALAKAQGAMRVAEKSADNPEFQSRYADLASIFAACREPLSSNGLAVIQRASITEKGVLLTTLLVHESGEWLRDRMEMPVSQKTAQAFGSAITYARRYALAAMVGVAAGEDDDGAAASSSARSSAPARQAQAPKRAEAPADPRKKTRERGWALLMEAKKAGTSKADFLAWAAGVLGVKKDLKEWTADEVDTLEKAHRATKDAA